MTPEEAFDLHHQAVFSFVYRLTGRTEMAEDITQDCFLTYLQKPERFDAARGASLRTYLISIARNLALKCFRDHGRESQIEGLEATVPSQPGMAPAISSAVEIAVAGLPRQQKEALILFEYEGFTLEEIAGMVGVDVGTIKSRLFRARERLRRVLAPFKRVGGLDGRT